MRRNDEYIITIIVKKWGIIFTLKMITKKLQNYVFFSLFSRVGKTNNNN